MYCTHYARVGPITIAVGTTVGANSFVNKSFLQPDVTIVGSLSTSHKIRTANNMRTLLLAFLTMKLRMKGKPTKL